MIVSSVYSQKKFSLNNNTKLFPIGSIPVRFDDVTAGCTRSADTDRPPFGHAPKLYRQQRHVGPDNYNNGGILMFVYLTDDGIFRHMFADGRPQNVKILSRVEIGLHQDSSRVIL